MLLEPSEPLDHLFQEKPQQRDLLLRCMREGQELDLLRPAKALAPEREAPCPKLLKDVCPFWDPLQQAPPAWWPHLPCVAVDPWAKWLPDPPVLWVAKRL